MAAALVGLLLALILGIGVGRLQATLEQTKALEIQAAPTPFDRLAAFYDGCLPECADLDAVAQATAHTEDAAALLCIEDQTATLLAIWHRESNFSPTEDDGDSYGIAQVRRRYERRLRKAWARLGVKLGPRTEIKTQIYMGAMVYRDKLTAAKGSTFGAVRRYNGRGKSAELYAYKVLASRGRIFPDKTWAPDERSSLYLECP